MTHDATTGFHDIKPMPHFTLASSHFGLFSALFLILLFAILLAWKKLKSPKPVSLYTRVSPFQIAQTEITTLSAKFVEGSITPKLFSTSLSQEVRRYLAAVLDFPAEDLTPQEINSALTQDLRRKIPSTSEEKRNLWRQDLISYLLLIEQLAYGSESAVNSSAKEVIHVTQEQATTATTLINQLELWLTKEQQRKDSLITNQSSIAKANAFS